MILASWILCILFNGDARVRCQVRYVPFFLNPYEGIDIASSGSDAVRGGVVVDVDSTGEVDKLNQWLKNGVVPDTGTFGNARTRFLLKCGERGLIVLDDHGRLEKKHGKSIPESRVKEYMRRLDLIYVRQLRQRFDSMDSVNNQSVDSSPCQTGK